MSNGPENKNGKFPPKYILITVWLLHYHAKTAHGWGHLKLIGVQVQSVFNICQDTRTFCIRRWSRRLNTWVKQCLKHIWQTREIKDQKADVKWEKLSVFQFKYMKIFCGNQISERSRTACSCCQTIAFSPRNNFQLEVLLS